MVHATIEHTTPSLTSSGQRPQLETVFQAGHQYHDRIYYDVKASLIPMIVDSDTVTLSDGGTFFVTVNRDEVTRLNTMMNAEKERQEREDECNFCGAVEELVAGLCKNVTSKTENYN